MSLFNNRIKLQEYILSHYDIGTKPSKLAGAINSAIGSVFKEQLPSPIECHNSTKAIARAIKKLYSFNEDAKLALYAAKVHDYMISIEKSHFNSFMLKSYLDTERIVFSKLQLNESLN